MIETKRTVTGINPTLDDDKVLEFCKKGIVTLEGVIPESTNEWVIEHLESDDGLQTELAEQQRFVEEVLLNPGVLGVLRSLLGNNFLLPSKAHNHRLVGPKKTLPWHIDAGSQFDRSCKLVYAFYIPQTNTKETGATYFMPGSHLVPITREEIQHFGQLAGQMQTIAPAGSVFIVHNSIWHRQAAKTDPGVRNLVRWSYWRTEAPKRDWIIDPDFDLGKADFSLNTDYFVGATRKWQSVPRVAEMFSWLCGKSEQFHWLGGTGWPYTGSPNVILEKEEWMDRG